MSAEGDTRALLADLREARAEIKRLKEECGRVHLRAVQCGRVDAEIAIAAWLREEADSANPECAHWSPYRTADAIESGAYRKVRRGVAKEIQTFVTERLRALLTRPNGWGPPHAVELQFLMLVEVWHVTQGASLEHVHGVTKRFCRFIATRLGGGPEPLAVRLGLDRSATPEFIEILREFLALEQNSANLPESQT